MLYYLSLCYLLSFSTFLWYVFIYSPWSDILVYAQLHICRYIHTTGIHMYITGLYNIKAYPIGVLLIFEKKKKKVLPEFLLITSGVRYNSRKIGYLRLGFSCSRIIRIRIIKIFYFDFHFIEVKLMFIFAVVFVTVFFFVSFLYCGI